MCAAPFLSPKMHAWLMHVVPEMHAWSMEKFLHVTHEMHAIYIPHEIQKTILKWSRHHLQLMEYNFL
jgi:hypothetical protein